MSCGKRNEQRHPPVVLLEKSDGFPVCLRAEVLDECGEVLTEQLQLLEPVEVDVHLVQRCAAPNDFVEDEPCGGSLGEEDAKRLNRERSQTASSLALVGTRTCHSLVSRVLHSRQLREYTFLL